MHWKLHSICGKIIILKNNLEKMRKKWGKSFCSEFSLPIKPFAASHSPPCWRAKVALGQDKQKANIVLNGDFLCLSHPSLTFALQHGSFVPREWLAAKGAIWRPEQCMHMYVKICLVIPWQSPPTQTVQPFELVKSGCFLIIEESHEGVSH